MTASSLQRTRVIQRLFQSPVLTMRNTNTVESVLTRHTTTCILVMGNLILI